MKQVNISRNLDAGLLVLRLSLGLMLLLHGASKVLYGLAFIKGILAMAGLPTFLAYGSIVGEVVAPLMIIVGIRSRIGAAIVAFNMLVAILTAHMGMIFSLDPMTGGWAIELPALYLFGAVVLCFTGAGRYALSAKSVWD
jgi:putative oxidoreductase